MFGMVSKITYETMVTFYENKLKNACQTIADLNGKIERMEKGEIRDSLDKKDLEDTFINDMGRFATNYYKVTGARIQQAYVYWLAIQIFGKKDPEYHFSSVSLSYHKNDKKIQRIRDILESRLDESEIEEIIKELTEELL